MKINKNDKAVMPFKRIDIILLVLTISVGLIFRLYKVNTPLADFHSWRQADTAAVSRNFLKYGFDLLHPRYDDLSSVQSGLENPNGYRMVEFPIYNAAIAFMYRYLPIVPLEEYGRLITIFFSLLTLGVIYYLLLKEEGRFAAVIASMVYAVFPFFVFFSRVVLPDTTAISCAFLAIFFLYLFTIKKNTNSSGIVNYSLAVCFFTLSLLIKPTTIFFGLTLLYLFIKKYGFGFIKKYQVYLFFLISIAPLLVWRSYIKNYPEGIPFNEWLIYYVNTYQGLQKIFFRPAFFRWIFFERVNNLILGGYLTVFLIAGILKKAKNWLFFSILLSSLAYLLVFQGGNVQHEYYQIMILPALAMFVGIGTGLFFQDKKLFQNKYISAVVILGISVFSFFISYYKVINYYNYSPDLVNIAKIIQTLTKPEDKIITDSTGDTTLLYLADRRGSPAVYKDLGELKNKGYAYFVSQNKDVTDKVKQTNLFTVVFENDKFTLFRL